MTAKSLIIEDEVADETNEVVVDEEAVAALADADDIIDEDLDPLDRLPAGAIQNDDGSVTLILKFPVTLKTKKDGKIKERDFAQLTFHRQNGADIRAVQAASAEAQPIVAFARSTRINQAIMNALFDKMLDHDIANAGQVINNFLASGRKTGSRGSA